MSPPKPTLVFAGLDAMGYGMAYHLLASGFPVIGYDAHQPAMLKLVAEGGQSANTPREAAKDVLFFICMVSSSLQATPLFFDENIGAVHAMPKNATILMCSTVAPAYIDELRTRLDRVGREDVRLVDCPVSGGAIKAANGTLSIFSSGDESHLANVDSILNCLSAKLYKVPGGLGAGSKARMIHEIFASVNIAIASEAIGLAAAAGLNTSAAFEDLKDGDGASQMFNSRVPHMLDPSLPSYSTMTVLAKEVNIITSTGRDNQFPLPLVSTAGQLIVKALSAGWGTENDCALVRLYLPGRENLVEHEAKPFHYSESPPIEVEDIRNMMIGVHLVATTEAMSFCDHLGIESALMFDIVSHAAGATAIFLKTYSELQKGHWSLKSVTGIEEIRDNLMAAVDKTYSLRYPLFLSSAALQEFHRQLQRQ
ncbi:hypothetical protein P7C71_g5582, partial [Lecanoromycetidae sp. Uapishka_2]